MILALSVALIDGNYMMETNASMTPWKLFVWTK